VSIQRDPRARALIFDLDGTLLDTMAVHKQAWRETAAPYGIDVTDDVFDAFAGRTSHAIVAELNGRFGTTMNADTVALAKDQAYVRHAPLIQPFPIVLEFLQANLGALPIAAATNENFGISNIVLRTTGLSSLFQLLVTADDVTHPKPAPDIYLTCAERLGVPPGVCQVFEDSAFGIEAATAAGMIVTDVTRFL
jgi:HAD superfamily hydrolase (TIGR01509 family)